MSVFGLIQVLFDLVCAFVFNQKVLLAIEEDHLFEIDGYIYQKVVCQVHDIVYFSHPSSLLRFVCLQLLPWTWLAEHIMDCSLSISS